MATTKKYYIRKNNLIQLKEVSATKKKDAIRQWARPKMCTAGWMPYETAQAIKQLDEELKVGLLTEIPAKLFDKNREKWLELRKDKEEDNEWDI
jgi:hypothetical protein